MEKISYKEFQFHQPSFPEITETEPFYLGVANSILKLWYENKFFKDISPALAKKIAINLTGYLQDIVSDAGIWRTFIDFNRKHYNFSIPFHEDGEEYIDYELNIEDIRFLVWYNIAMLDESRRTLYPHDSEVLSFAKMIYDYIDSIYEEAPVPKDFNLAMGLEFHDIEDQEKIYHLGNWLFLHCYLLTPSFALTLHEIMSDPKLLESNDVTLLQNRMEQAMMESPIGPIALFTTEWLQLLINGSIQKSNSKDRETSLEQNVHPYYQKFIDKVGDVIKYFGSYEELNTFLIETLGWKNDEEHLPVLKNAENLILLVNKERGMLVARNIAKCIADPKNPFYDKSYAQEHAFSLLTVRGKCPVDLLKYIFLHNYLPDAVFPGTTDHELIRTNNDFIARCFLQQYYRD